MERNLAYYSKMKKVVNHFLEICQLTPENLDEQVVFLKKHSKIIGNI
ncbi:MULTISPECIES: hypothetical protein [Priestia]|nr:MULTISPECIES: hypothetical protein [Priestia]